MASSSKKSKKFAKISETLFYIGLFFFVFAVAVLISLAAKGTFAADQEIESGGMVLCALVGVFGGVGFISLIISFVMQLQAKKHKQRELLEAKNKPAAAVVPSKLPEGQKSPVINISIPKSAAQPAPRVATPTPVGPRPVVGVQPRPMANVQPRPVGVQPRPMANVQPRPMVGAQPRPMVGVQPRPMATAPRPVGVQPRVGVSPVRPAAPGMGPRPTATISAAPGRTVIKTADGRLISVNTNRNNVGMGQVPPRPVVRPAFNR